VTSKDSQRGHPGFGRAGCNRNDALLKVEIRDHQYGKEYERIDDEEREQRTEVGVAPREVSNAGGYQCDGNAEVGELLDLEGDLRNRQRQNPQNLCDRELYFEKGGKPRWTNAPSGPFGNGKWSLKMKLTMLKTMTAQTMVVAVR
jgi:hypothetical protein